MCSVDAPEAVEIDKPTFVHNPFLDDDTSDARSADALRRGRSSLVIPTGQGIGFDGRGGSTSAGGTGNPNGNGRPGGRGGNGGPSGIGPGPSGGGGTGLNTGPRGGAGGPAGRRGRSRR